MFGTVVSIVQYMSLQVMPDNKTVYTTDDGTNVGFYMFKSENPGPDLSAGKAFCVCWPQCSSVKNYANNVLS
jgi:hypothetical protein